MAKNKGGKAAAPAGGKPKHSKDANRPNKGVKGQRDAATVSCKLHCVDLASWRARAEEIQLDEQGLAATFPDMVGLTLGLDLDSVLGKDPEDWEFSQALGAFLD